MKHLSACRLCGGNMHLGLQLQPMPLVDDYDTGPAAELYPTELLRCADCGLVQLSVVMPPAMLFGGYSYRTGHSPGLVRHFRDYAAEIGERAGLTQASLAIDIGANDGTLLRELRDRTGCAVLGIDPCPPSGDIPMRRAELTPDLAGEILAECGPADLVTANNVLAHVDDLAGMLRAARMVLRPGGWFACEVGSLEAMCAARVWETVYHEHLSYFDAHTLASALRGAGLWPGEIRRVETHGGSLRAICRRVPGGLPPPSPDARPDLAVLPANVATRGAKLRELRADNAVAFGASAKASVILWQTGLRPSAVIDDNPLKQGKRMPGTNIPVVNRKAIAGADRLLVLAWNELPAIAAALPEFAGRLIVAAPEPYLA